MSNVVWERLGALSGIVFVAILIAGFIVAEGATDVEAHDPATIIAAEFADNRDRLEAGGSIGLISLFFLFWFLGYLRSCLQQAEGEGGWVASVAFGGGLLAAGMLLVSGGFTLAGSVLSDYGRDPQVARTLAVLNWDWIAVVSVPLAALVGGTAVVGLRFNPESTEGHRWTA